MRSPFIRVLGAVLAGSIAVGIYQYTQGTEIAKVRVSASGNDTTCARNKLDLPCATFNKAYTLALSGDVVEVDAGTYGAQTIAVDATKLSSEDVWFRPLVGASILLDGALTVNGDHMTFENFTFANQTDTTKDHTRAWLTGDGADDLTFINIDASYFYIADSDAVNVIGGDYGPCEDNDSGGEICNPQIKGSTTNPATNVLIDGVTIHDISRDESVIPAIHTGCLSAFGGQQVTIRNSRFYNCPADLYNINIQNCCGAGDPLDYTIENNWFTGSVDLAKPASQSTYTNITIRFNSGTGSFATCQAPSTCSYTNVKFVGNISAASSSAACPHATITAEYLVSVDTVVPTDTNCGTNGVNLSDFPFVNTNTDSTLNYHLLTGVSSPNNLVPTSVTGGCPSLDYDKDARPIDANCDAGADER